MLANLKRTVDTRQGFGVLLLALIAVSVVPMSWSQIAGDLTGTLGLYLAFAIAIMVPRRWHWLAFYSLGAYLVFMSGWWLYLHLTNQSKNGLILPGAFALAAAIFVTCGTIAKRRVAKLSP